MRQKLSIDLTQKLELKQKLSLTQQLKQAINVLQVNQVELKELIEQEVMENPVLDFALDGGERSSDADDAFEPVGEKDSLLQSVREFERYFDNNSGAGLTDYAVSAGEADSYESFVSETKTLSAFLEEQLFLSTDDFMLRKIGLVIIASLDSGGYLKESVDKIARSLLVEEDYVLRALELVQSLEPVGIAARDLRECLLLQMDEADWYDSLVEKLILNHLEDLAANRLPEIQKETGADFNEIMAAWEKIKTFNPKPASGFQHEVSKAESIRPDVFVSMEEGELKIELNRSFIPRLGINSYYQEKIRNAAGLEKEELFYLKKKLESALWFRQCIEKRNETIYEVVKEIFTIQAEFFTRGIQGLKPMKLTDIAERVSRHEATVARTVNGKYVQTPDGVYELKFFFSGGLKTEEGDLISSRKIKEIISTAIQEENPLKPLSDQFLCDLLKAQGIEIARRTVAKYRESLNIPSSSRRKKYV